MYKRYRDIHKTKLYIFMYKIIFYYIYICRDTYVADYTYTIPAPYPHIYGDGYARPLVIPIWTNFTHRLFWMTVNTQTMSYIVILKLKTLILKICGLSNQFKPANLINWHLNIYSGCDKFLRPTVATVLIFIDLFLPVLTIRSSLSSFLSLAFQS